MASIKTTTVDAPDSWAPDQVSTFKFEDVLADNLYLSLTTFGGKIEGDQPSLHVPYVSDADDAQFTAEGAEIAETTPGLNEVLIQTRKIAQLVTLSTEQSQQVDTARVVADSMKRNVVSKLNHSLLTQVAPTAPAIAPSAGLVNTAGIIEGDPLVGNLDPLVDLISELESNYAAPKFLVIDPLSRAALYKLKAGDASNEGLLSPVTAEPVSAILGLQVIVSPFMPANTGLIVDPAAIVSAYSPVSVAQSTDAKFTSDAVVYRVTTRVGHAVVKADRLATISIGAPVAP
ncbi:phage major capsid protein [Gordonia sp. HY442]|uniref:phage major capsid protein n=1 Tax=Gordonia zhenghanii TaxID=2911516 RepID=UPI001F01EBEA|nr:phage major capsid protein [Gordonia zhenghanii]MCF8606023.1 phage major capsid protein [Gordonia zhenghanii]